MSSIVLSQVKRPWGCVTISTSDNKDELNVVAEYEEEKVTSHGTFTRNQKDYWVSTHLNDYFYSNVFLNDTEIAKIYNYYIQSTPVETYFDNDTDCKCDCCRGECPGNA